MKFSSRLIRILVWLLPIFLLASCQQAPTCDDPVGCFQIPGDFPLKIGVIYPFASQNCPTAAFSYQALSDYIVDKTILDRQIELVPENSFTTSLTSQVAASRAVNNPDVVAVLLLACETDPATGKILHDSGLPYRTPDLPNPLPALQELTTTISSHAIKSPRGQLTIPLSLIQENPNANR